MELRDIVDRYAEAIEAIDQSAQAAAFRGHMYQAGFAALSEPAAVRTIDAGWERLHPGERSDHRMGVAYSGNQIRADADHVISSRLHANSGRPEWAVEVKRLQFVGDNGKGNDFAVGKVLSPYLKDRGMLHDALRLQDSDFTERVAVVGYGFDYDAETIREGRARHSSARAHETLANIEDSINRNGPLHLEALVEFADAILGLRGLKKGPRVQRSFEAWAHPAGGRGLVFGWEIRRPRLEPGFDPRHPW